MHACTVRSSLYSKIGDKNMIAVYFHRHKISSHNILKNTGKNSNCTGDKIDTHHLNQITKAIITNNNAY